MLEYDIASENHSNDLDQICYVNVYGTSYEMFASTKDGTSHTSTNPVSGSIGYISKFGSEDVSARLTGGGDARAILTNHKRNTITVTVYFDRLDINLGSGRRESFDGAIENEVGMIIIFNVIAQLN